jgi:hypothetical protein
MTIYKVPGSAIQSNTITITQIQTTAVTSIVSQVGPRVSSLIYPGDDTAGNTVGGQTVYINGSGFETNNAIYINGNAVPSKSFISASNLSFTTPALAAGTYPVYVINTDSGSTAIFANPGLQVSGDPLWITTSPLTSWGKNAALSRTLQANSDSAVTYSLAEGSSLPSGLSLAANGLISGTLSSPPANTTTYNFTVVATDAENQNTSRAFSIDAVAGIIATGGTVSNIAGYRVHTFTSNGSFTVTDSSAGNVEFLIVGGGGGGGFAHAGGGGGGGVKSSVSGSTSGGGTPAVAEFTVSATTYAVVVGNGGAAGTNRATNGVTGGSSSVFGVTALGGGGGGSEYKTGVSGGTGGGGATGVAGGAGTAGNGFAGGTSSVNFAGGGGGGAGAVGANTSGSAAGAGGSGIVSSINGTSTTYGGGGGGGSYGGNGNTRGLGGAGGGGNGNDGSVNGSAGTNGLGGGGGGGGYTPAEGATTSGSAGGSGIVIIRYPV